MDSHWGLEPHVVTTSCPLHGTFWVLVCHVHCDRPGPPAHHLRHGHHAEQSPTGQCPTVPVPPTRDPNPEAGSSRPSP